MNTQEDLEEARRLLSLSQKDLEVEEVALAIRIGRESEEAAAELHKLDVELLEILNPIQGEAPSMGT